LPAEQSHDKFKFNSINEKALNLNPLANNSSDKQNQKKCDAAMAEKLHLPLLNTLNMGLNAAHKM